MGHLTATVSGIITVRSFSYTTVTTFHENYGLSVMRGKRFEVVMLPCLGAVH